MIKILLLSILIPTLLTAKQEYIGMSHKISDPFVKEFAKKNRMYPIGLGGGMMYDVDFVAMIFSGTQQLGIPEVRRLYVQGMEDLLARYNTNLQIRPYLHYFPISTDLFDFGFMFQNSRGGICFREIRSECQLLPWNYCLRLLRSQNERTKYSA